MNPFAMLLDHPPKLPTAGSGRVHRIDDFLPYPPPPVLPPATVVAKPAAAKPQIEPRPVKLDKVTRRRLRLLAYLSKHGRANAVDLSAIEKVHVRTIYRDVADLQELGYPIDGLAGNGYVWRGERTK